MQAYLIATGVEVRDVLVAVDLVAVEAADPAVIHVALHEIVALHTVLVRGEVGELVEVCRAGLQLFELPVVVEAFADFEAYGPVVVLVLDGVGEGLALAVALDAGVVGADEVEAAGVDDVRFGGVSDVEAAGAVAFLAADVPLGDLMSVDVVVDGVAAVAQGAGRSLHVALAVVGNPPVGSLLDVVGQPALFVDVPLCGKHEVVLADFGEVTLLIAAAVDEGDLFQVKGDERIGVREVAEDCVGVLEGIAHDVGHAGLFPAGVLGCMAALAGL